MRTIASIEVYSKHMNDQLKARLHPLTDERGRRLGFKLEADQADPRVESALRILAEAGLQPSPKGVDRSPRDRRFYYVLRREYEHRELLEFSQLEVAVGERSWQPSIWGRTRDGELIVPEKRLETELDILSGEGNCVFVTPRAKAALERAGFREVTFRPTCFVPYVVGLDIYGYPEEAVPNMDVIAETGRKADDPIRYWEIDSPLTLPPVSPSMDLVDRSGTPLEPECGRSIVRREGFFVPVELRYRAADLSAFGPFDLARTCEAFALAPRFDRTNCSLIASRRFYEACASAGLKAEWSPVRIDP